MSQMRDEEHVDSGSGSSRLPPGIVALVKYQS